MTLFNVFVSAAYAIAFVFIVRRQSRHSAASAR